jgi:flagellar hook-length control protein FliK
MNVTAAPAAPTTGTSPATATDGAPTDGAAAGFAALLAALAPGAQAALATVPGTPTPDQEAEPGKGDAEGQAEGEETPVLPDAAALLALLAVPAPVPTVSTQVTAAAQVATAPADGAADEPTAVAPAATAQPQASQPMPDAPAAQPATQDAAPEAPTTTAPTAPVAGVAAPTAASGTTDAAPAAAPAPVSRQLFDRIEKLATSGNGTHRVTVRLDPGTLGEVRVHLTVREGQVHVRLSAGAEAQAALSTGAGELQRLLEGAKASAQVRVDVRGLDAQPVHQSVTEALDATALSTNTDTSAGSTTSQQQNQPGQNGQLGTTTDLLGSRTGSGWTGQQTGSSGAHAGTRRATTARDGDQDGVEGPSSVDLSTTRPQRGVDVRM